MFGKTVKSKRFQNKSGVVHLVHMLAQAEHLVAVAPLVVIPGDELDEVLGQSDK